MIELENVSMTYPGGNQALKDININIEKGEFVFIVGSSGSGKTTLFRLLLKELDPTEGNITVAGYDYGRIKKRDIPKVRRRIGIVFQNFRLLKDRTIYENVAFAQRVIQTPNRYIRRRVPAMLTLVGLADKYKAYPKELSGGEQQRVAMARALVNNPDIILADEPTGNLDPKNSMDIMNLLEDINKRGTTVVVVTHNKEIVNEMKKRVITLMIVQGFVNIRRNILFSLASIGTIISCLFLFGIIYAVVVNFQSGMNELENTVTISVFFDEGASQETIDLIGEQIRTLDYVNTMDFISADDAWKSFAEQNYDDPETAMDVFGDDNPLANAASYEVTLKDVSRQAEFVSFAQDLSGVRKVVSSEVTADSISTLSALVGYASVGIVLILMLVSIFLISNTITIGITVRKEEISIMKLIGATNVFVRAPFIIEGIIIGAVGSAIPLVLLYYMYDRILAYVAGRFQIVSTLFAFVSTQELFATMIPVGLILGIGVGLIGSILTTRKHLKV